MADQVETPGLQLGLHDVLLKATNALTLADELLELALRNNASKSPFSAEVRLLRVQVTHVLLESRRLAGLNPDGSFARVPPPAPKKGGAK